jgi:hypothetical protein
MSMDEVVQRSVGFGLGGGVRVIERRRVVLSSVKVGIVVVIRRQGMSFGGKGV